MKKDSGKKNSRSSVSGDSGFSCKLNLLKGRSIKDVSPEALSFLMDYDFPGNIRELENIVEYAFVMCKESLIELSHLPRDLRVAEAGAALQPLTESERNEAEKIRALLDRHQGNRDDAARALSMGRTTLWRKMKKCGILDE